MKTRWFVIPVALLLVLIWGQAFALDGAYTDKNGVSTYKFDPEGVVDITTMGTTMEMQYEVVGDKIKIDMGQGGPKMVLSILPDGSISGPGGVKLTKTVSAPTPPTQQSGSTATIKAPKFAGGMWVFNGKMTYKGKHKTFPSQQKCLTAKDLHNLLGMSVMPGSDATPEKMQCTTSGYQQAGNTMIWNFVCSGPHKGAGTVSFTHTENSFTAHLTGRDNGDAKPMKMTSTAKRLGDCSP